MFSSVVRIKNKWESLVQSYVRWRCETFALNKVLLSLFVAFATALASKVRIPLPWTPVPITAQTLVVLLSGIILGGGYAGASQVIYVIMGVAGIPVFSGWGGGIDYLSGPTGGYILGFIAASLFVGHFYDRGRKGFFQLFLLLLVANFLLIHGFGLLQLYMWLSFAKGEAFNFYNLLMIGSLPFVPGDLVKIVIVATLAGEKRKH